MSFHNKFTRSSYPGKLVCYIIKILHGLFIEIFKEEYKLRCVECPLSCSQQCKRNVSKYVSALKRHNVALKIGLVDLLASIYALHVTTVI